MTPSHAIRPETLFLDVSYGLENMIHQALGEDLQITFDSPAEVQGEETTLIVYLYQVRDDPYLWNEFPQPVIDREKGTYTEEMPPLGVELLYMMVPYSQSTDRELIMANQLKNWFHAHPVLKLDNRLNPQINIIPDNLTLQQTRDVWNVFTPKAYRLTLFYILSPVRVPSLVPGADGWIVEDVKTEIDIIEPSPDPAKKGSGEGV